MTEGSALVSERSELRLELAYGATLGVAVAALAALPGAFRVTAHGQTFLLAWLGLFGAAALIAGPVVALGRLSRSWAGGWLVIAMALLLCMPAWMLLGSLLKSGTHHRPLGAATYAFLGLFVLGGGLALAARLSALLRSLAAAKRRSSGFVLWAGLALLALVTLKLAVAMATGPAWLAAVDGVLFAVLALGAVLAPARRVNVKVGLIVWLLASVLGVALFAALPALRTAAAASAPVLATFVAWLVG